MGEAIALLATCACVGGDAALAQAADAGAPTPPSRAPQAVASSFGVYPSVPTWTADPKRKLYDTGVALADIDGDGWTDLVVSSGNDQASESLDVYFNHPAASDPSQRFGKKGRPEWTAEGHAYFGHVAAGDIDGDGCIDVAVSIPLSSVVRKRDGAEVELGGVRVYKNEGRANPGGPCGGLARKPAFESETGLLSISCALADVDADGDLDLVAAVLYEAKGKLRVTSAGAVPEGAKPGKTRIFLNRNGAFEKTAGWVSEIPTPAADVTAADFDQDGLLDLALSTSQTSVHFGSLDAAQHVSVERKPGWQAQNSSLFSYAVSAGRVAGAATLGLAASFSPLDWGPSQPLYPFFLYLPSRKSGQKAPVWSSDTKGRGSRVLLADVDRDGLSDLLTGRWADSRDDVDGSYVRIYHGVKPGYLTRRRKWDSAPQRPVAEGMAVANLYGPASRSTQRFEVSAALAGRSVLTLDELNVDRVVGVTRNGAPLAGKDFAYVPGASWISLTRPMTKGEKIEVDYTANDKPDLVVADWEPKGPLAVYRNRGHEPAED